MPIHSQIFDTRQSMTNKRFEIFHYCDQLMRNVSVHHHDFYEVYFFLSGNVSFRVEGRTYHLGSGDILLINPQELHQSEISPDSPYERIVLWIDGAYLAELSSADANLFACFDHEAENHTNLLRLSKNRRAAIAQLLEKLTHEFYSNEFGSQIFAEGLLMQFLVEINRYVHTNANKAAKREESALISQVLSYISAHFHENITLESLAATFYVSKYYLSHEFRNQVGTSVYRYVIFRRLMHARNLMAQGQAPGEVYGVCGFGDYANFYRAFKAEYGISPREYVESCS